MPSAKPSLALSLLLVAAGVLATLTLSAAMAPAAAEAVCKSRNVQPQAIGRKEARRSVHCLINKERNQRGKGGYSSDRRLVDAAVKHSRTMARKNCFSHQCRGENSLQRRLQGVGYLVGGLLNWAYGENIAYGTDGKGTPAEIVDAWMHSPPHRSAILSGTFKEMGVGFENRGDKGFYTADFGLRRG
jgi:uncharacterized protein YkwD